VACYRSDELTCLAQEVEKMKEQQRHGWVYYNRSPTFMGQISERMTGVVKAIKNWWPA